jgi:tetratricopeptide (TPR) repeat protein
LDSNSLDTPGSGKAWNILGLAYEDLGEFTLSQHAYEESLRILEGLPDNIRDYAMALRTKALGLYEKVARGSNYLERAVKEARLANDMDDDDRIAIASLQGWKAQLDGDFAMSVVRYRQALDLSRRFHGEEHPFTGWDYLLLGTAHAEAGQLTTALEEMRHGVAVLDRTLSHENPRYLVAEIAYSRVLDATGSHAEAARIKSTAEPLLKDVNQRQCTGCTISAAAFH